MAISSKTSVPHPMLQEMCHDTDTPNRYARHRRVDPLADIGTFAASGRGVAPGGWYGN